MFGQISLGEVKDLGNGKWSVRLTLEAPEGALARTETVVADGHDTAVQIAKESFSRWLRKVSDYVVKSMPAKMRN